MQANSASSSLLSFSSLRAVLYNLLQPHLANLDSNAAVVKLDFKNAFNSIRRDRMLLAVSDLCPSLFHFVHSAYASPPPCFGVLSSLFCRRDTTGRSFRPPPLLPLLHSLTTQLRSKLCFFSILMMEPLVTVLSHSSQTSLNNLYPPLFSPWC